MTKYTASKASIHQKIRKQAKWLNLALLLIFVALTAYHFTPAPADATPGASGAQASAQDPAMQSVLTYLRAHSGETAVPTPAASLDPAQQSVMQYVRAHERADQPTTLWDQVTQVVLGYLWAHSK
jgi:hypothetical protein